MEKTKEEEIGELADILLKSGLATSMTLAVEKAKEMLNVQEKAKAKHDIDVEDGIDITKENKTINELMKEAGIDAEEEKKTEETVEEGIEEKAEDEETKEEAEEAVEESGEEEEKTEEKSDEEEGEEITIEEGEESEKPKEELKKPTYDEEKKIDISKVFNYGRR